MKFKHTVNVLIDNFGVTFKLLVYHLIILAVTIGLSAAIIVPLFNGLENVAAYTELMEDISNMLSEIIKGEVNGLAGHFEAISTSFNNLLAYLAEHPSDLILSAVGMVIVILIRSFLVTIGNYTAGCLISDKMAMQANSPFAATMIKNLGKASLYSVIYVPISFIYNAVCVGALYIVVFIALSFLPIMICIFLFIVFMILLTGLKMILVADWMPALISGKKKMGDAMAYSITRESGGSVAVYSFFASSSVLILALNSLGFVGTFGAAIIITIPLSYIYLLCYQFVNYCDNNNIKYFTDKRTIVKPEHEKETSRQQFLRGE